MIPISSPEVSYNPLKRRYEAKCSGGVLDTIFVFPPDLKDGDDLPNLYLLEVPGASKAFRVMGHYDSQLDNIEFALYGPSGYFFKMSVQMDGVEEEPYIWKVKKHGETNGKGFYDHDVLHIPRSACLARAFFLDSPTEVLRHWTFFDKNVPGMFCKLRMKVRVEKGSFDNPPIHVVSTTEKSSGVMDQLSHARSSLVKKNVPAVVTEGTSKPQSEKIRFSVDSASGTDRSPDGSRTGKDEGEGRAPASPPASGSGDDGEAANGRMGVAADADFQAAVQMMMQSVDRSCILPQTQTESEDGPDQFQESQEESTIVVDRNMEITLVQENEGELEKCTKIGEHVELVDVAAMNLMEQTQLQEPASKSQGSGISGSQAKSGNRGTRQISAPLLEQMSQRVFSNKPSSKKSGEEKRRPTPVARSSLKDGGASREQGTPTSSPGPTKAPASTQSPKGKDGAKFGSREYQNTNSASTRSIKSGFLPGMTSVQGQDGSEPKRTNVVKSAADIPQCVLDDQQVQSHHATGTSKLTPKFNRFKSIEDIPMCVLDQHMPQVAGSQNEAPTTQQDDGKQDGSEQPSISGKSRFKDQPASSTENKGSSSGVQFKTYENAKEIPMCVLDDNGSPASGKEKEALGGEVQQQEETGSKDKGGTQGHGGTPGITNFNVSLDDMPMCVLDHFSPEGEHHREGGTPAKEASREQGQQAQGQEAPKTGDPSFRRYSSADKIPQCVLDEEEDAAKGKSKKSVTLAGNSAKAATSNKSSGNVRFNKVSLDDIPKCVLDGHGHPPSGAGERHQAESNHKDDTKVEHTDKGGGASPGSEGTAAFNTSLGGSMPMSLRFHATAAGSSNKPTSSQPEGKGLQQEEAKSRSVSRKTGFRKVSSVDDIPKCVLDEDKGKSKTAASSPKSARMSSRRDVKFKRVSSVGEIPQCVLDDEGAQKKSKGASASRKNTKAKGVSSSKVDQSPKRRFNKVNSVDDIPKCVLDHGPVRSNRDKSKRQSDKP